MKLSKTMEEVMEYLKNAQWYYLDATKEKYKQSIHDFYTRGGKLSCFQPAHILKDGSVGIVGHTNTLKALERRGLIEILEIGGNSMDKVRLIGMEWSQPLKTAVKVNIWRKQYSDYTRSWIEQNLEGYVEDMDFIEQAEADYKEQMPRWEVKFTPIEEVELIIWEG